ncbi:hypothetical protein [Spirosoma spitsbergense]|uniref:hypothetical protein n=1 Tax=Spirosoma spitsbergense TaxID=431554 RepID=UPI00036DCE34|nr:hypothetical protein [Spirosoma spitsbergense]
MLNKLVTFGLFVLILCHTLASVLVWGIGWWQAEGDLSERLQVYRSVDSIVEFRIPLDNPADGNEMARTTEDGFRYRGHYYSVVSLEVTNDTLHIAGLETRSRQFWSDDLLAFLNDHLNTSDTSHNANQLLKFLLKEYSPNSHTVFIFDQRPWRESVRIPQTPVVYATRSAPIHSPPPNQVA